MKRIFAFLFGFGLYNLKPTGIFGKSEVFYMAPSAVWRKVKDVLEIEISKPFLISNDRIGAKTDSLSYTFFLSLPVNSPISESEVKKHYEILRIDRTYIHENEKEGISFVFYYIAKARLRR
jgi:hypothetical protein